MTIKTPAALLAGADAPHGRHERLEGWDAWRRAHTTDDADALTRGRHARPADTRPAKETAR